MSSQNDPGDPVPSSLENGTDDKNAESNNDKNYIIIDSSELNATFESFPNETTKVSHCMTEKGSQININDETDKNIDVRDVTNTANDGNKKSVTNDNDIMQINNDNSKDSDFTNINWDDVDISISSSNSALKMQPINNDNSNDSDFTNINSDDVDISIFSSNSALETQENIVKKNKNKLSNCETKEITLNENVVKLICQTIETTLKNYLKNNMKKIKKKKRVKRSTQSIYSNVRGKNKKNTSVMNNEFTNTDCNDLMGQKIEAQTNNFIIFNNNKGPSFKSDIFGINNNLMEVGNQTNSEDSNSDIESNRNATNKSLQKSPFSNIIDVSSNFNTIQNMPEKLSPEKISHIVDQALGASNTVDKETKSSIQVKNVFKKTNIVDKTLKSNIEVNNSDDLALNKNELSANAALTSIPEDETPTLGDVIAHTPISSLHPSWRFRDNIFTAMEFLNKGTSSQKFEHTLIQDFCPKMQLYDTARCHSITVMPRYESKSFEELRFEDYLLHNIGAYLSKKISLDSNRADTFNDAEHKLVYTPTFAKEESFKKFSSEVETVHVRYNSITAMKEFNNYSFEELRLEFYLNNKVNDDISKAHQYTRLANFKPRNKIGETALKNYRLLELKTKRIKSTMNGKLESPHMSQEKTLNVAPQKSPVKSMFLQSIFNNAESITKSIFSNNNPFFNPFSSSDLPKFNLDNVSLETSKENKKDNNKSIFDITPASVNFAFTPNTSGPVKKSDSVNSKPTSLYFGKARDSNIFAKSTMFGCKPFSFEKPSVPIFNFSNTANTSNSNIFESNTISNAASTDKSDGCMSDGNEPKPSTSTCNDTISNASTSNNSDICKSEGIISKTVKSKMTSTGAIPKVKATLKYSFSSSLDNHRPILKPRRNRRLSHDNLESKQNSNKHKNKDLLDDKKVYESSKLSSLTNIDFATKSNFTSSTKASISGAISKNNHEKDEPSTKKPSISKLTSEQQATENINSLFTNKPKDNPAAVNSQSIFGTSSNSNIFTTGYPISTNKVNEPKPSTSQTSYIFDVPSKPKLEDSNLKSKSFDFFLPSITESPLNSKEQPNCMQKTSQSASTFNVMQSNNIEETENLNLSTDSTSKFSSSEGLKFKFSLPTISKSNVIFTKPSKSSELSSTLSGVKLGNTFKDQNSQPQPVESRSSNLFSEPIKFNFKSDSIFGEKEVNSKFKPSLFETRAMESTSSLFNSFSIGNTSKPTIFDNWLSYTKKLKSKDIETYNSTASTSQIITQNQEKISTQSIFADNSECIESYESTPSTSQMISQNQEESSTKTNSADISHVISPVSDILSAENTFLLRNNEMFSDSITDTKNQTCVLSESSALKQSLNPFNSLKIRDHLPFKSYNSQNTRRKEETANPNNTTTISSTKTLTKSHNRQRQPLFGADNKLMGKNTLSTNMSEYPRTETIPYSPNERTSSTYNRPRWPLFGADNNYMGKNTLSTNMSEYPLNSSNNKRTVFFPNSTNEPTSSALSEGRSVSPILNTTPLNRPNTPPNNAVFNCINTSKLNVLAEESSINISREQSRNLNQFFKSIQVQTPTSNDVTSNITDDDESEEETNYSDGILNYNRMQVSNIFNTNHNTHSNFLTATTSSSQNLSANDTIDGQTANTAPMNSDIIDVLSQTNDTSLATRYSNALKMLRSLRNLPRPNSLINDENNISANLQSLDVIYLNNTPTEGDNLHPKYIFGKNIVIINTKIQLILRDVSNSAKLYIGLTTYCPDNLIEFDMPYKPSDLCERPESWTLKYIPISQFTDLYTITVSFENQGIVNITNGDFNLHQLLIDYSVHTWPFFVIENGNANIIFLTNAYHSRHISAVSQPAIDVGVQPIDVDVQTIDVGVPSPNEASVNISDCVICYENAVNTVFYTCGHSCLCLKCGRILLKQLGTCPICRCRVRDVIRIYKS